MTTVGTVTFHEIKNVRKSGDEENVYFADVTMTCAEGFPAETHIYCARGDDYAPTGRWVYSQIVNGNFVGEITQLLPNADPMTGLVPEPFEQPSTQGAQTL